MSTITVQQLRQNLVNHERQQETQTLDDVYAVIMKDLEFQTRHGCKTSLVRKGRYPVLDADPEALKRFGLTVEVQYQMTKDCDHAFNCGRGCKDAEYETVAYKIGFPSQ